MLGCLVKVAATRLSRLVWLPLSRGGTKRRGNRFWWKSRRERLFGGVDGRRLRRTKGMWQSIPSMLARTCLKSPLLIPNTRYSWKVGKLFRSYLRRYPSMYRSKSIEIMLPKQISSLSQLERPFYQIKPADIPKLFCWIVEPMLKSHQHLVNRPNFRLQ